MAVSRTQRVLGNIAANMRRLRDARGWTQKELARRSGFMWRSIQVLETGTGNPTVKLLIAVADALGVKPTALFRATKTKQSSTDRPPAAK